MRSHRAVCRLRSSPIHKNGSRRGRRAPRNNATPAARRTEGGGGGFDKRKHRAQNGEAMPREMNLATRLALIVGGTIAYLGLAILGSGGPAVFFSHPALIALT